MTKPTTVERTSERELVYSRTINGPARLVYEAWTQPELFKRWWGPKSLGMSVESCEMDVRVGGKYRIVFPQGAVFFGTYLEVTPNARLSWTNEEDGDNGPITTVTFEEKGGSTRLVVHELHPSKEALDVAAGSGVCEGTVETFEQLNEFIVAFGRS